nr:MAG TPA: MALT1 Ig-like domain [Caudoviricetes sp.]DAL80363.1 MAG TPA: MALT1 Ig-like domain [Caudoviricetes sp.]DAU06439.1 MAG TPA: MALT1 Ig-like domain [Caudoviricetes sp.]
MICGYFSNILIVFTYVLLYLLRSHYFSRL